MRYAVIAALVLACQPVVAQQRLGNGPLAIEAASGIEWRRDERVYIASGKAKATQGNVSVAADKLIARYRDGSGGNGGPDIYRVEAEGNVQITSGTETAVATKAVYDIDRGLMALTGSGLRLTTPTQTVTARDSLEYWQDRKVAVARGQAVATEGQQRVQADTLTAHIVEGTGGQESKIAKVEGFGNVRVSTPDASATGAKGVYNLETSIATLVGGVKVTQGRNQLNGEYAEVNMKSGISRILSGGAGAQAGAPVRALLVPQSDQAPANTARPNPTAPGKRP
ncbi:LptA/OstA family protein [Lacibacterium aquatile]|uniref:LptA/OstA family protein n=1 Tax=Lacibacterium aquatile TaxID=1168082 RepID=A0ABW5DLK1_9PROT